MCALPCRRPSLLFPSAAPPGRTPSNRSPPPQALPSPGSRRKEGARKQEGCKSRSELPVAVPPSLAARAQGARDSAADARCRCGGSCCSCGCGWAGGSGRAALGAGRRGAAAGATRSHSPHGAAAATASARVCRQHSWAVPGSRAKARKKARLTSGARGDRLRSSARQLCSSPALRRAPGSAAGAAHELPT